MSVGFILPETPSHDEVALPVAGHGAVVGLGGPGRYLGALNLPVFVDRSYAADERSLGSLAASNPAGLSQPKAE